MKKRILSICTIVIVLIISLTGCNTIDNIKLKLGFRNDNFEYLKDGSVKKISIQSTRDLSFKFVVTDQKAITEMYDLLSNAKVSEERSTLEPDYIMEIHVGKDIKKFYYVVGEKDGNFYDEKTTFNVSNRLDEGIMKNLSFIRKPREFEYVYYESILQILKTKKDEIDKTGGKVGIDISGDIDCLKYVLSADLQHFLKKANKTVNNVELVKDNKDQFDILLTIEGRGYDSTNYKTKVIYQNKKEKVEEDYYITAINEFKEWEIEVSEPNEIPKDW